MPAFWLVVVVEGGPKQFYIRTTPDGKKPTDARAQDHDEVYQLVPRQQESIEALEDLLNSCGKPAGYPTLMNKTDAKRVLQNIKTGDDSGMTRPDVDDGNPPSASEKEPNELTRSLEERKRKLDEREAHLNAREREYSSVCR